MRRTLRAPSYFAYTTLFRSGHLVARQENIGKVVPIYIPDGNSPSIVEISVFVNIEIGIECESVLKVNTCHLRGEGLKKMLFTPRSFPGTANDHHYEEPRSEDSRV